MYYFLERLVTIKQRYRQQLCLICITHHSDYFCSHAVDLVEVMSIVLQQARLSDFALYLCGPSLTAVRIEVLIFGHALSEEVVLFYNREMRRLDVYAMQSTDAAAVRGLYSDGSLQYRHDHCLLRVQHLSWH
jgi:hypothetical protein